MSNANNQIAASGQIALSRGFRHVRPRSSGITCDTARDHDAVLSAPTERRDTVDAGLYETREGTRRFVIIPQGENEVVQQLYRRRPSAARVLYAARFRELVR